MNQELKAKWVAALRSGEYKQGQGAMRPTPDTYCCLAVLRDACDVDPFQQGFGHSVLVRMNDGEFGERKHSFDEIADWIEANL